jgi:hypothetical protein
MYMNNFYIPCFAELISDIYKPTIYSHLEPEPLAPPFDSVHSWLQPHIREDSQVLRFPSQVTEIITETEFPDSCENSRNLHYPETTNKLATLNSFGDRFALRQ